MVILRQLWQALSRHAELVPISETRTKMVFLSAFESFVQRTLAAVPEGLERLDYFGRLRQDGTYAHWGLSREYGERASEEAVAEAHSEAWIEILRTPLPVLLNQLARMGEDEAGIVKLATGWESNVDGLTPEDVRGGNRRHFSSILLALSLLSRSDRESNRQAA